MKQTSLVYLFQQDNLPILSLTASSALIGLPAEQENVDLDDAGAGIMS